jgi:hypothetical protein
VIKLGGFVPADVDASVVRFVDAMSNDDRVEAVWLFGSRARNEADALSDIDLAVLARRDLDAATLWDAQIEWTNVAVGTLHTDEVAIHVLNRTPIGLRDPILRGARLLWARSPEVAADFAATTLKQYLDFNPSLAEYDRILFEQAASGRLR